MEPLVSVILICYNHALFVKESILSVVGQSYKNIELIVVDDNSSDNSALIIQSLASEFRFNFIQHTQNQGLNKAIITALANSSGEYISFLASDDFIVAEKIESQVKYLLETDKDGVYATGFTWENDKGSKININPVFKKENKEDILHYLYQYDWGVPLQQSSLLKREVMINMIPLRQDFKSDDWAFIIKVYENYNIGYIDKPLFYYRLHGDNTYKKYWFTFPMRMDIASRLVPQQYRRKTISTIFLSQGHYLLMDKQFFTATRFFISSLVLHLTFSKLVLIMKYYAVYFRKKIRGK